MKYVMKIMSIALLFAASACTAADKTAGNRVDDGWIHTKVKSALVGSGAATINVEVHKGVVQLAGFVDSQTARETAGKTAAAVQGVTDVSNQLVVQTSTRTPGRTLDDGVVAGKVKTRLADSGRTSAIEVNVDVRHGVVLLSGFVNTDAERDAAAEVAGSVDGVIDIVNGIDVVPAS